MERNLIQLIRQTALRPRALDACKTVAKSNRDRLGLRFPSQRASSEMIARLNQCSGALLTKQP